MLSYRPVNPSTDIPAAGLTASPPQQPELAIPAILETPKTKEKREPIGISIMPHPTGPSTPAAAITAIDEKLTTATISEPVSLSDGSGTLPYWLVNVPRDQWPPECPAFLRDLPDKNVRILSTPDEHYKRQGWEEVQEIISSW